MKQVGRYALLDELGSGGMGVVYRGCDPAFPEHQLAIKLLTGEVGGEELARFRRESSLAIRLRHPGLVQVVDAGEHQGHPYLVMQLLDGQDLSKRLHQGPLAVPEAVALGVAIADALEHAHQHGVIHRDLKPANVVLTRDGPVITDLGLAKSLNREGSLTATGEVLGTPSFMAPEQIEDAKRVDARVDVYALGATLFALLAGRPPFQGQSLINTLHEVLEKPAPRLRDHVVGAPPWLDALVSRCMAKDPADRPASAAELRDALRTGGEGGPSTSRRPALAAALVAATLAVAAAAAVATTPSAPAASPSPERPLEQASVAGVSPDEETVRLGPDPPWLDQGLPDLLEQGLLDEAEPFLARRAEGGQDAHAWLRVARARGVLCLPGLSAAYQRALELAPASDRQTVSLEFGSALMQRARTLHQASATCRELGDVQRLLFGGVLWFLASAEAQIRPLAELPSPPRRAAPLLGELLMLSHRFQEARSWLEGYLEGDLPREDLVRARHVLGFVYQRTGRYPRARDAWRLAHDASRSPEVRGQLKQRLESLRLWEQAYEEIVALPSEQGLARTREALLERPFDLGLHVYEVLTLFELERYEEVRRRSTRALRLGLYPPPLLCYRGLAYVRQQKIARGEADLRAAMEAEPEEARFATSLARALAEWERWEESDALYRRVLERDPRVSRFLQAVASELLDSEPEAAWRLLVLTAPYGFGGEARAVLEARAGDAAVRELVERAGLELLRPDPRAAGHVLRLVAEAGLSEATLKGVANRALALKPLIARAETPVQRRHAEGYLQLCWVLALAGDEGGWLRVGECLIELGRPTAALQSLTRAAELQPERALAHGNLAVARYSTGQVLAHASRRLGPFTQAFYLLAFHATDRSLALNPQATIAYRVQATVLANWRQWEAARDVATEGLRAREPGGLIGVLLLTRALALGQLGDREGARRDLQRCLGLPREAEVTRREARALLRRLGSD